MVRSRVIAITLVDGFLLYADSTSVYKTEDLIAPELEELLPHAESMQIHWLLDDVLTNEIDWNIDAFPGWDRNHEVNPVSFFNPDRADVGSQLFTVTALSQNTNYMRHVRLQLKWRLRTGISGSRCGKLSAILYVTLKGQ